MIFVLSGIPQNTGLFNRAFQSVVFNNGQKMAKRVFYFMFLHRPLSVPSFGRYCKQLIPSPSVAMSFLDKVSLNKRFFYVFGAKMLVKYQRKHFQNYLYPFDNLHLVNNIR